MKQHNHNQQKDSAIKFGLVLNTAFTVVEFTFGVLSGSLALVADAAHNLTDTFTLSVSFVANRVARRDANSRKSFGYGRTTILAALLNASIMLAVAGVIAVEAIVRLGRPHIIEGGVVIIVALAGVAVNGTVAYVLSKRRHDLNMRSAFIDMAFDALSSLAAVISGIIIVLTGLNGIDSIIGLLIAGLLAYNTLKILSEAVQILLEGTPSGINVEGITASLMKLDGVQQVDDLHIWTIRSGYNALSCHIIVDEKDLPDSRRVVERAKAMLVADHDIQHATIEVELMGKTKQAEHEHHWSNN